jgi:phage shock protein C
MRVITVALTLFSGLWPGVIVYFAAAVLIKPEPVTPMDDDREREFYESYASSRKMALHRLKRMFDSLERRIQRMEDTVTAREYDWDRRLNQ